MALEKRRVGRQFFANPGPTNIPDSVLSAMHRGTMDFMEAEFVAIYETARAGLKRLLFTEGELFFYAATGHGAWEATLVNMFSPGEAVLVVGGGYFPTAWASVARRFGIAAELLEVDWRQGVALDALHARLAADTAHEMKALCVVHNETSTGVALNLPEIRAVLDDLGHPALLLVDTISSLGSLEFRMDEWGIDAVVGGSQKGLMLPTGLAFTAAGPKAMAAHARAQLPRFYFDWSIMLKRPFRSFTGSVPIVPFFGMVESIRLIEQEGYEALWARHHRLAAATRAAVRGWGAGNQGPELYCSNPDRFSDSVTAVLMPDGVDTDAFRALLLARYSVSTGGGLDKLGGRVFRIGHMGDLNEPMLLGTLGSVELALRAANVPHAQGGVTAALESLAA